jgi:hypothetical protein
VLAGTRAEVGVVQAEVTHAEGTYVNLGPALLFARAGRAAGEVLRYAVSLLGGLDAALLELGLVAGRAAVRLVEGFGRVVGVAVAQSELRVYSK